MKSIFKTTVALCGSALVAISGSTIGFRIGHRSVYAETDCIEQHNIPVITSNAGNTNYNQSQFYSGFSALANNISTFGENLTYSANSLSCSTIYGEWSESFRNYNCYAYALGRTDKKFNIGEFSGIVLDFTYSYNCDGLHVSSINNSIQELADFTVQDLKNLGYNCVYKSKNSFTEPYDTQTLICVRKSKNDFHFMKYVDGYWLHKPGGTWILKYNGTPNVNDDWISESAYMNRGKIYYRSNEGYPYTGDIYFFKYSNNHYYNSYQYYNDKKHAVICNYCLNTSHYESHNFELLNGLNSANAITTKQICTVCGYVKYSNGMGFIPNDEDEEYENN